MFYKPGIRIFDGIKLNTNENFFSTNKNINKLLILFSKYYKKIRFYPDSDCIFLKNILSKFYNLNKKNFFICNGSDEGLAFLFIILKKFFLKIPIISYPFYKTYCFFNKIIKKEIALKKIFKFKNLIFPFPNSPTGEIIKYKNNNNKISVIDEAYADFSGISLLNKKKIKNNIIIKTFSKSFSCANIRIGFIFSNEKIIKLLEKVKNCFNSYTTTSLSNYIAIECIKNIMYYKNVSQKINYIKVLFYHYFENKIVKSYGNFIFIKINIDFYYYFKKIKIIFRYFIIKNCFFIRITIPNHNLFKKIKKNIKIWK